MEWLSDLLASPAGLAIKGAVIAAFLDFVFGVYAAFRDGTFALDHVAAFVRKHLLGRVFPASTLALAGYYTEDPIMIAAAAAALAAYAAETLASIYSSVQAPTGTRTVTSEEAVNPIPTD